MTTAQDYAKGYRAGVKKGAREQALRQTETQRSKFIERAALAMLPVVFGPNFTWGDAAAPGQRHVPYKTPQERIDFAWKMAREAWERRVT